MGQAKRRGTYKERKAIAEAKRIEDHKVYLAKLDAEGDIEDAKRARIRGNSSILSAYMLAAMEIAGTNLDGAPSPFHVAPPFPQRRRR